MPVFFRDGISLALTFLVVPGQPIHAPLLCCSTGLSAVTSPPGEATHLSSIRSTGRRLAITRKSEPPSVAILPPEALPKCRLWHQVYADYWAFFVAFFVAFLAAFFVAFLVAFFVAFLVLFLAAFFADFFVVFRLVFFVAASLASSSSTTLRWIRPSGSTPSMLIRVTPSRKSSA